jgi:hypothetical protein
MAPPLIKKRWIPMAAIDVAYRYFEAWNGRDPSAIIATFAEDGIYNDPTSG